MTVSSNDRRKQSVASASQTSFPYDFQVGASSDLVVTQKIDATGVVTTLTETTEYTVNNVGDATGTIDLVTGAAVNDLITCEGQTPVVRDTDFDTGGDYFANTVNTAEDLQYFLMQELTRDIGRSMILPASSLDAVSTELPEPVANELMQWNSAATALQSLNLSSLGTSVAYTNRLIDTFAGDGVTTAFVLSADPGTDGNVDVYKNGVHQDNAEYVRAGATITFTTAPAGDGVTDNIEIRSGTSVAAGEIGVGAVEFSNIAASAISDDGTLAGDSSVELVTEHAAKTYADSVAGGSEFADDVFRIQDDGDATKEIAFQASGIAPGTLRTITMPDANVDLTVVPNTSGTNTGDEVSATLTVEGIVERSTSAENVAGTSDTVYATVLGTKEMIDTHAVGGGPTLATPQDTTSGTDIDFTSIDAGTLQLDGGLVGVSFSGVGDILIQLGDAGGFEASGYTSESSAHADATPTTSTTGFLILHGAAARACHGNYRLRLVDSSTNTWSFDATTISPAGTIMVDSAGSKSLSGELTQIRISGGTFDAGKTNIQTI